MEDIIERLKDFAGEGRDKGYSTVADQFDEAAAEILRLREEIELLREDTERVSFIEGKIRESYTGVSFDFAPSVEGDSGGYRMMWRRTLCDRKKTIRAAIDEAMTVTPNA